MQKVTILLVEDDPGHARLIEKNLRRVNVTNKIVFSYRIFKADKRIK
jgi:DNA-binding response OmpR family regulator